MRQAVEDRHGEAITLYNLASLDVEDGEYQMAWTRFDTALKISQSIGNRRAEARIFFQLGFLADTLGRARHATRLAAVSYLIHRAIGEETEAKTG